MKLKFTVFLFTLGLFTLTNLQAQQDPAAKRVLDAVKNRYEKMKAFGASFSYSLKSSSGVTDNFSGSITIAKGMFRLKAGGQEVMTDGKTQWTYLKETNEANVTEYEPDEGIHLIKFIPSTNKASNTDCCLLKAKVGIIL